jgi:hypothetical protein
MIRNTAKFHLVQRKGQVHTNQARNEKVHNPFLQVRESMKRGQTFELKLESGLIQGWILSKSVLFFKL